MEEKKEDVMGKYRYRVNSGVEAGVIIGVTFLGKGVAGEPCRVMLEDGVERPITAEQTARMFPVVGDYLVRQPDGYEYLNPKDVFEGKFEEVRNRISPERLTEILGEAETTTARVGEKTTLVHVKLPNGFEITETSSCVDPANYDHDMGCRICMKRVESKVWELEGYLLQSRLAE